MSGVGDERYKFTHSYYISSSEILQALG